MTITPEVLADLRKKAAPHFDHEKGEYKPLGEVMLSCHMFATAANPAVVLALLDRIADRETALYELEMGDDL